MSANKVPRDNKLMYMQCTTLTYKYILITPLWSTWDISMPCSVTTYLAREQCALRSNYTSAVLVLFDECALIINPSTHHQASCQPAS